MFSIESLQHNGEKKGPDEKSVGPSLSEDTDTVASGLAMPETNVCVKS